MGWAWLLNHWCGWRRRRSSRLRELSVLLYTRKGCHLCETAWETLQTAQRRERFALRMLDLDTRPEWVTEYGSCVPVVSVNGKVRFRGAVNPVLLDRLLWAERQKGLAKP